MKNKMRIVITSGFRWNYFQWFLLGFHELENRGLIKLDYSLPLASRILLSSSNKLIIRIADKCRRIFEPDSYNMDGYILYYDNGKKIKKTFTIDSADAPYLFDSKKLNKVDIYFKMQCPIDLKLAGFYITDLIMIPWCDHEHEDCGIKLTERGKRKTISLDGKNNIRPLMVGPRQLSKGTSYDCLKAGYDNYLKGRNIEKAKNIMCDFGNALGPKPEANPIPDYDWEADIMGFYGESVNHPNEKRENVAKYIARLNSSDARVISTANADSHIVENKNLIIPLEKFCKHIAAFKYNANVSGYRLSMPSRFIESFMVGTSVITDKLAIKWYKPFDTEVVETVPMGYLPMNKVDWKQFQKDLNNLPSVDPSQVIKAFEEKWSPKVVAQYIIDTVKES